MSGLKGCSSGIVAALAVALTAAGCGGGQRQNANEPSGKFPVTIVTASFPSSQRLAQHTHLVITVRNDGQKTIPNLAVTICNVSCTLAQSSQAAGAQAFSQNLEMAGLAAAARPIWIVDQAPGACSGANQYSCRGGGPGGDVTAYTNTWASGPVKPGATVTMSWGVTAVKAGTHVVSWEVAAGLGGKAKAVLADGSTRPVGAFRVTISNKPAQSYVNNQGQVIETP